jgi:hypothetical protein
MYKCGDEAVSKYFFYSLPPTNFYAHFKEGSAWRAENPIATVTSVVKVERDTSTTEWVEMIKLFDNPH